MTRSGFYRFCLAKMLGYSEEDSRKLAEHRAVLNSVEQALAFRESSDVPVVNSAKVRAASKAVIYKLRKPRKSGVE